MNTVFYIAAAAAILSTVLAITRRNAVHALLYMILSLLAGALIFFVIGAPYIAALQVIVYAGAIMVLFVFVIMMLNQGPESVSQERLWMRPSSWIFPSFIVGVLLVELLYILRTEVTKLPGSRIIETKEISLTLFGPYILLVELASMLLLAGLIGAYHLGRRDPRQAMEKRS